MKRIRKEKIKGIALTLLLLIYVCTSSSVYAKAPENLIRLSASPIAEPDEEELIAEQYLPASTNGSETLINEIRIPLVQNMTQAQAFPDTLYQEGNLDSFFDHTVFVGDSLSVGFANYCKGHPDSMATDTTYFLAKESCSARVAISADALTAHADIMPLYHGTPQYIEDSIAQMKDVEKVFLCYGMNDLVTSTPEQYISDMETLIQRILVRSPQVTIYVISIPCIVETAEAGRLNNGSIQMANSLLQTTCEAKGWGFVNLAEYLMDANLAICPEYSSDGYVHENNAAYAVWVKVLRNYAYKDMTL